MKEPISILESLGRWQPIDNKNEAVVESTDNLEGLNNDGHALVTEDFEDSPHADRQYLKVTDEGEEVDPDLSTEKASTSD